MKHLTESLFATLDTALLRIRADYPQPQAMALEAVILLHAGMEDLKQLVVQHGFADTAAEIEFFKCTKPRLLAQLLLYNEILRIELERPQSCVELIKQYIRKEMLALESFPRQHWEFYLYYRKGSVHLDETYFTRKGFDIRHQAGQAFVEADHRFRTSHDGIVAIFMANDLLLDYLNRALEAADQPATVDPPASAAPLTWTESKTALVELIYALHAVPAINHGQADIRYLATCFERLFGIQLGDYYRTWLDLRMRKTGRTKFLEQLREQLLRRMEEADDRY